MRYVLAGVMLVAVAAVVVAGIMLTSAKASLSADSVALAKIGMPLGGGSIQSVSVVSGPHSQAVPVEVRNDPVIMPTKLVPAGTSAADPGGRQAAGLDLLARRQDPAAQPHGHHADGQPPVSLRHRSHTAAP